MDTVGVSELAAWYIRDAELLILTAGNAVLPNLGQVLNMAVGKDILWAMSREMWFRGSGRR